MRGKFHNGERLRFLKVSAAPLHLVKEESGLKDETNGKTRRYGKRGNPFKRGNTWTILYYPIDPKTGKKKQRWKGGFKTKKEAQEALYEINAKINSNTYIEPTKMTLAEYLTKWYGTHCRPRLSSNTLRGYRVNIENHIIPNIGHVPIQQLSRGQIQKFYFDLYDGGGSNNDENKSKKLSERSIQYIHRVLNKALKDAVRDGILIRNPAEGVSRPTVRKYQNNIYDANMLKILLEAANGTDLYIPVTLGVSLGLRRGEVLGLQWKNINFNTGKVEIRQQASYNEQKKIVELTTLKTENSIRTLPMPKGLVELLLEHKEKQEKIKKMIESDYIDNDLVCCHNDGTPLNPKNFSKKFRKLLEKNNFPIIRFHDLRHSYATLMLESNVDLKVTSAMLGHSSVTITADIYQDALERKEQASDAVQTNLFE